MTASFLSALSISAAAQGDYLKYGEGGVDLNIFGEIGSENKGNLGGKVGISLKGVLDFGFSILAAEKTMYSPSITLNLLKQDRTGSPICLSLTGAVASTSIDRIFSDNIFLTGPVFFSNIRLKHDLAIQPSFHMGWQGMIGAGSYRAWHAKTVFEIGLSFFKDLETGESIKFETAYLFSGANYGIALSIGLLFREDKPGR